MNGIISQFAPISLDEMSGIRLMNRTDTKFVTSREKLMALLRMAVSEYRIQEIDGMRNMHYYTIYFDTPDFEFYNEHHDGHCQRQKVRIRSYVDSHLNFLEVKTKDNHGRTSKKRTSINETESHMHLEAEGDCEFLRHHVRVSPDQLDMKIENRFRRITLVNKAKTERLTIDTDLEFHNLSTDIKCKLDDIAIIELKRDGMQHSPVIEMLRKLHIHPNGFSKYCIGSAITNPELRQNRIKPRLREILKEINN